MAEMSNTATGSLPQVVIVTEAVVRAEATEEPAGEAEMVRESLPEVPSRR